MEIDIWEAVGLDNSPFLKIGITFGVFNYKIKSDHGSLNDVCSALHVFTELRVYRIEKFARLSPEEAARAVRKIDRDPF